MKYLFGEEMSRLITRERSVQALIISNTVPLVGVAFFGWSLYLIMYLYWLENVIIGWFNVLRMSRAEGSLADDTTTLNDKPYDRSRRTYLIIFFILHYGMFTAVHGAIISFISMASGPKDYNQTALLIGVSSLVVSHGISYFVNFIGKGEYKRVTETKLFIQPYARVIVLHLTTILGAFLVALFKAPLIGLVLLIVLKTLLDIWAHTREHKSFARNQSEVV